VPCHEWFDGFVVWTLVHTSGLKPTRRTPQSKCDRELTQIPAPKPPPSVVAKFRRHETPPGPPRAGFEKCKNRPFPRRCASTQNLSLLEHLRERDVSLVFNWTCIHVRRCTASACAPSDAVANTAMTVGYGRAPKVRKLLRAPLAHLRETRGKTKDEGGRMKDEKKMHCGLALWRTGGRKVRCSSPMAPMAILWIP
jgi:hypothetical protein